MPYIGNQGANRFVAPKAASVFSGDGSDTTFTLDHAVSSDEDILVSVDGVIQEPSVAYAVSNGTTLTFTAAPSNNSGNNIFVYYLFRTVGTVGHPSNQALSATTGTFSGNIVIPDAGNIGSASDTDAMSISSGGVVTFSQTPVGTTNFVKVSGTTSTGTAQATDLTALTIDLPVTTDFEYLKLILRLRAETTAEQYWHMLVRNDATNGYLTGASDYIYMAHGGYLNTGAGSGGAHAFGDTNGISYIRYGGGFSGDGSEEEELFYLDLDIYNTVGTDRGPRFYGHRQAENRSTDEWTYADITTGIVTSNIQVDQIKFVLSGGAEFSNFGHTLYKVTR